MQCSKQNCTEERDLKLYCFYAVVLVLKCEFQHVVMILTERKMEEFFKQIIISVDAFYCSVVLRLTRFLHPFPRQIQFRER